jgi:hypothetical protein
VSGTLFGSDGAPIAGGQVVVSHLVKRVWQPMATLATGADGTWTFTSKADDYRFAFSATSADPGTAQLVMERGRTYTLDMTLAAYGTIGGTIAEAGTDVPLGGATVDVFRRNADGTWPDTPYATSTTAADGSYATGSLPCGSYAVRASASGHVTAFVGGATIDTATPVVVLRGQVGGGGLALAPEPVQVSAISGVVVSGALRTPVSNCSVFIFKQNADGTWPASFTPGNEYDWVFSAVDGTYTSGPLPIGNYRVRFFTVHGLSQWWQYAAAFADATTLSITSSGQSYTGIEGWYSKP